MFIMKKKLLIIGASGHGKVVADIAIQMNQWKQITFLDDDESKKTCMGLEIIGNTSDIFLYKDEADFFVAIGDNSMRESIQEELVRIGAHITTLIHPNAVIGEDVKVGLGTTIMAGAVINSSSVIGNGCIINTSSSLDHDNFVDDYAHVSPGVRTAGNVKIGKGTWVGIGSVISNNVNVCGGCKLGAGAVVVKDIIKPGTYIGVPIKKID